MDTKPLPYTVSMCYLSSFVNIPINHMGSMHATCSVQMTSAKNTLLKLTTRIRLQLVNFCFQKCYFKSQACKIFRSWITCFRPQIAVARSTQETAGFKLTGVRRFPARCLLLSYSGLSFDEFNPVRENNLLQNNNFYQNPTSGLLSMLRSDWFSCYTILGQMLQPTSSEKRPQYL